MIKEEFLESRVVNGRLIAIGKDVNTSELFAEYEANGRRCELTCQGCEDTEDAFVYANQYLTTTSMNAAQDAYCVSVSSARMIKARTAIYGKIYEAASQGNKDCEWWCSEDYEDNEFNVIVSGIESEMKLFQAEGFVCIMSLYDPDDDHEKHRLKLYVSWEDAFNASGSNNERTSD